MGRGLGTQKQLWQAAGRLAAIQMGVPMTNLSRKAISFGLASLLSATTMSLVYPEEPYVPWHLLARKNECSDQTEWENIIKESRKLLLKGDFQELEDLASEYQEDKSRTSDGRWKLALFYYGVGSPVSTGLPFSSSKASQKEWDRFHDQIKSWNQAYPESTTAKLAQAEMYTWLAWKSRGHGYASELTEEQVEGFHRNMKNAENLLVSQMEEGVGETNNPHYYTTLISILRSSARSMSGKGVIQAAMELEPEYTPALGLYANFLLPRWGAEPGELFAFAEVAANQAPAGKGPEVYARIMMRVVSGVKPKFFKENFADQFSWEITNQGFHDMEERYPDSCWNLNSHALFASIVEDKETAKPLFERIGKGWDKYIWREYKYFEESGKWARRRK